MTDAEGQRDVAGDVGSEREIVGAGRWSEATRGGRRRRGVSEGCNGPAIPGTICGACDDRCAVRGKRRAADLGERRLVTEAGDRSSRREGRGAG
jgi:hypothetical protein